MPTLTLRPHAENSVAKRRSGRRLHDYVLWFTPPLIGDSIVQSARYKRVLGREIIMAAVENVVLVHGGFVDGSGWEDVYKILKKDGYDVGIVQNPTLKLAGDVAATRQIIGQAKGPVVLVGHSYGGVVITEAGNDAKV